MKVVEIIHLKCGKPIEECECKITEINIIKSDKNGKGILFKGKEIK